MSETVSSAPDGSGKALVDHWSWASKRGLMNTNTAGSLRAAVSQVLGILDGWQTVDVRTLDVDDVLARFVNLRKKDFKPESLDTYTKRFRQALSLYEAYLDDPAGWRPQGRSRAPGRTRVIKAPEGAVPQFAAQETSQPLASGQGMITYPYQLRPGVFARLTLPADLTLSDVRRLAKHMESLVPDSGE